MYNNSGFYDTSSSIYPDEKTISKENFYRNPYKTPSPMNSPTASLSSFGDTKTDFFDDVYKPYVTPPSPFEKSTKYKSNTKKPVETNNPYAQSLWYTFRGNDGREIDKYKKITTETKLLPSLMEKTRESSQSNLFSNSYNNTMNSQKNSFNYSLRKEISGGGESLKSDRSGWSNKIDKIDEHMNINFGKFLQTPIDSSDYNILKPLNNPPPFELISIQSLLVKKLKLLMDISNKFDQFVSDMDVLINPKIKPSLFSNVKTLLIIHHKFLDSILNRDAKIDLEETIYDHLQRLYHVYPSYLKTNSDRKQIAQIISNASNFKQFVINSENFKSGDYFFESLYSSKDINNNNFFNLIMSPAQDFKKLLEYLNGYIGKSSPRINVLISKFLNHFDLNEIDGTIMKPKNNDNNNEGNDYLLFMEIPNKWKTQNKIQWKEISLLNIERKIAYYLRWVIKNQYQKYCKIMKMMRSQIEQITRLAITNHYISKNFIQLQTELPYTSLCESEKYKIQVKKAESENREIYNLVEAFNEFINSKKLKQIDGTIIHVLAKLKKIYHSNGQEINNSEEGKYQVGELFNIHQIMILFEESMQLVGAKYVYFLKRYFQVLDVDLPKQNIDDIIRDFQKSRSLQQENMQEEEAQLREYNNQLGRVCAKGRLMERFFSQ